MRRFSTTSLMIAITLVAMPVSFAQTSPANPVQSLAQPGGAVPHESQAEIRTFEAAPVSLSMAIANAEKDSGSRAVDAMFALEGGTPFYVVKTYGNDALWEGKIDANTGELIGPPRSTAQGQLTGTQHAQLSQLQNARGTLMQAVAAAEQKTGGKAISAVLAAGQGGALTYDVETVKNGGVQMVAVNAQSGQIVAVQAIEPRASSGSSVPPAPAATLPGGASTDKSLGEPPPGSTRQNPPLSK